MDASLHIRPFGFDQIFATAYGEVDPTRDLDPWLRIEALRAELAIARQDGEERLAAARGEGFMEGQRQAREEQGAALLAATDAIHGAVENVEAALDSIAEQTVRDAAEVACAAAEMLAARALEAAPAAAIGEAIGRALRQIARGQEIQVAIHPGLVDAVEEIIAVRQAGDRRRLLLSAVADPAVAWGDAHIHWDQGGIVLDASVRAEAVAVALAGVLPPV